MYHAHGKDHATGCSRWIIGRENWVGVKADTIREPQSRGPAERQKSQVRTWNGGSSVGRKHVDGLQPYQRVSQPTIEAFLNAYGYCEIQDPHRDNVRLLGGTDDTYDLDELQQLMDLNEP